MARRRTWILVVPIGLLAIAGTWLFVGLKRRSLHPDPQAIPSLTQANPSPKWSAAVDRARSIIRASLSEQSLPGLSIAVGAGGDLVWAEGFGWADIKARLPVTPQTRFRIGTASTLLTSAAVGLLLQKGKLTLDNEIQAYVPQFPKKQWPLTLRHVMAHVGGLPNDAGDEDPLLRQRCERPVEALPQFAPGALQFEPGTQYRYSKYGWILASAAVEAAAGQPFLTFLREQIFQPLGMANTGAESAKEENPSHAGEPEEDPPPFTFIRRMILEPVGLVDPEPRPATDPATIYSPGSGPNPVIRYGLHVARPHNLSCYAGSMAFLSTAPDLVRFGLAIHGATLLQPATVQSLLAPQRLTGHGLDWDLNPVTHTAGHDGKLVDRGMMSLKIFRETGIVVAVLSNIENADTSALALKVAEAFAQPRVP